MITDSFHKQNSERTYRAVKLLMDNAAAVQKKARVTGNYAALSRECYLKEYCTVCCRGPRQTGHSHTIKLLTEAYPQSIVIAPALEMIREPIPRHKVASPYCLDRIGELKDLHAIFIDNSYLLSSDDITRIYEHAAEVLNYPPEIAYIVHM